LKKRYKILPLLILTLSYIYLFLELYTNDIEKHFYYKNNYSESKNLKLQFSNEDPYIAQDYIGLSDDLWDKSLTGNGVKVALLDTGIYPDHLVFTNNGTISYSDKIIAFYDNTIKGLTNPPYDIYFHGTWTASILGGNSSEYEGVAPGVNFVIMKVFEEENGDVYSTVPILRDAADWLIENKNKYDVKIVSMSFGALPEDNNMDEIYDLEELAEDLIEEDMLVVVAAGNNGDDEGTITAPGSAKSVLTVGGVHYNGDMYIQSGRGPTHDGDIKPDVCAPAVRVYGADANINPNSYDSHSGTSGATPFVSGLAALMLEKDHNLKPLELKNIICLTAFRTENPRTIRDNVQGWGIIQGYAALDALEDPILLDSNAEFEFELTEDYRVFCQPITLDSGYYFFELKALNTENAEAEMYIFNEDPDEYGNPILISHTINWLHSLKPAQRMGIFVEKKENYFLVVKLIHGSNDGSFKISLIIEYRISIIFALLGINIIALIFITIQLKNFNKIR